MRPQRVVKNNLGILDFAEKKRMKVFKYDVTPIEVSFF